MLGREPVEVDLEAIAAYLAGRDGARHRRRRLDRLRALPPDRARRRRSGSSSSTRARRRSSRSSASSSTSAASRPCVPVLADVGTGAKMRQVFERYRPDVVFHAAAYKHVPLMEANPLEAVRNNALATQRRRRGRGRVRRRALRARLDRQGGQPEDRDGPVEGALRVDRRGATAPRDDVATRFVAVRFGNVLGSSGQRDPDLPPPDRARRPGDGHAPGDDALLHDDPRGGRRWSSRPARSAAAARSSCSTWASRCRSSTSRAT